MDDQDQEQKMMKQSKKITKIVKTETASRKSSLEDRLENLKLDKSDSQMTQSMGPKLLGSGINSSQNQIQIPKPIKMSQSQIKTEDFNKYQVPAMPKLNQFEDFKQSLSDFKSSQKLDLMGIEKYLFNHQSNENQYPQPLIYFPYGAKVGSVQNLISGIQTQKMIGPLTFEQRQDKVSKFLDKKKNRKWKLIRYTERKTLADNRLRFQGRFVQSNKPKFYMQIQNMSTDDNIQSDIPNNDQNTPVKDNDNFSDDSYQSY